MHIASRSNQGIIVELLDKLGFQITPRTRTGRTPLHLAAEEGHIETIELLDRLGTDRSDLDESKHNALHLAAKNGNDQVVSRLLGQDVNPLLQNNQGERPFTWLHVPGIKALSHYYSRSGILAIMKADSVRISWNWLSLKRKP
jgi:ankyrin repeat protein